MAFHAMGQLEKLTLCQVILHGLRLPGGQLKYHFYSTMLWLRRLSRPGVMG